MEFTQSAKKVLDIALIEAKKNGYNYVGTEHILLGLILEKKGLASKVLLENDIDEEIVRKMIADNIDGGSEVIIEDSSGYSPSTQRIIERSQVEAKNLNQDNVATEHILLAILKDKDCIALRILNTIKGTKVRDIYLDLVGVIGVPEKNDNSGYDPASKTPILDNFSRNLTKLSKAGFIDPVIGRTNEINRVIQILSRRTKNNPCLIGEPGVGKTSIAEGLANLIVSGEVPATMRNKEIVTLDIGNMVAGTKYRGEFEERIKRILVELRENPDIILFIDEIHTIIGAGNAEGALDAANILKPALARGEIQIIGATTTEEYRKHIEKDAALERRFQTVTVNEPSEDETIEILKGLRPRYEKFHNVTIGDDAILSAVKLGVRYIPDRNLPDKAIDLIDEACSKVKIMSFTVPNEVKKLENDLIELDALKEKLVMNDKINEAKEVKAKQESIREELKKYKENAEKENKTKKLFITEENICDVISNWTKIPVSKITEDENKKLLELDKTLHKKVIGQDDAVVAIAKAIRRNRVGLKDPNRPIGTFLFMGPTGVGKTELCKALSDAMFGSVDNLIRVDMSEYMEKHTVSKLIGSPPGYVGFEEGGQLTEKIRRNPYAVVLFDEIEKAHQDIFNILLQVLDEGHMTDSQGRKVSFKNSIIILTSNIGANQIMKPTTLGFDVNEGDKDKDYEIMKNKIMDEVKKTFKPEFINRLDDIIVFHKLSLDDAKNILDLLIKDITNRTKENMNITLNIDDNAKDLIIKNGFDEQYGARKLKRTLTSMLEDLLAEEKLNGNIIENDNINIVAKDDKLYIKK